MLGILRIWALQAGHEDVPRDFEEQPENEEQAPVRYGLQKGSRFDAICVFNEEGGWNQARLQHDDLGVR